MVDAVGRLRPGRIVGVDLARGLALVGMSATHMLAVQDPDTGHLTTVGWLAAGRASSLFALLAGVSLALVTGGTRPKVGAARLEASVSIGVRAALIGVLGLWLAATGTHIAVILAYYALLFVLAIPFLGLGWRTLAILAAVWSVAAPVISHLWRSHLPPGPGPQVTFETFGAPWVAVRELLVIGYYPVLTWLTYVLAGLAVGRLDLRSSASAVRLVVVGAVVAAGSWAVSAWVLAAGVADRISPPGAGTAYGWFELLNDERRGTTPTDDLGWLWVAAPHTGTPLDLIGTTGSALAVLGACLLITRIGWVRTITRPVAAAGTMTLTLYLVHGFALSQTWGTFDDVRYWLLHVGVALAFATVWLHFVRRGPVETVVHDVSALAGRVAVEPVAPRSAGEGG